ncbi:TipJ family phage tail tip protein [Brevundimonas sp. TWP2-2]|uniref:TipJ family phage tail tip protein n=1 Tax=unclassified Brevundimonas TaxID=2622653 RepID=UPI003CF3DF50
MADGSVPIVLSPEPFARTTVYVEAPAGCTVRTMLASAITHGHLQLDDLPRTNVYVDGERLDREEALSLVLAEGQVVNVVVEPLGGGGGKKDIGQILLTIAVIAVSMWVGGPTGPLKAWPLLAKQVAAAAILTAGQMAVAAIFKPETNIAKVNDRYALSSASNQYRPWASMPMALGEVVVAPDLAVKTFTQAQGEDQWIYGILGLHYGPCTAEDLKIGDTLVSSMGASDVRVAYHLTPGPRAFSIVANDTDQLDLQEELAATVSGSTAVVRAASAEGERFEFDFFMPQGLYFAKDDGRKIAASLTVTIRYRPIDQNGVPTGSGAWADGLTIPLSSASSDPWRIMRELALPLGRYEFEVKRSKLEDDNAKRKTDIGWTAIRAIAFRKPVLDETLSLIEFAVRASALNQGNLAPFTCRITPVCETWNGSAWGTPAPTSNPAAITRWLMTGPAPAIPLTKPQADVGLRTWAALCDQYNWKSHIYLTEDRKQDAVMQLLGMNGRASLFWDGTQLVSAPWVEKPAPRQLFAGSNLKDHRWEIVYPDTVHALRVEFQNIDQGGEADEIYVYADGYGETADPANNILPATLVEALRLEGQQTIERAYRDGRWNLGARMHQRRVDSWSTDIGHIVCRYGDRVRLAWDRVGTANATVRNRLWSGALVSGLRLSQPVRMEPGKTYALDLRLPDQVITGVPIVNTATTGDVVTRSILFADLRNANVSPRGGDLVAFGEPERISEDVEIIGITPGTDLTANMVGIRYVAPLLMAGETGPIPPLQSRLTRDRAMDPPMPTLLGWQVNEEGVRIGFSMPPWRGSPITGFTVRWRQTPAAGQASTWLQLPDLPANAMTAVTPPLRELPAESTNVTSAQVQIVAVTADGRASPALQITVQEAAIQQPPAGDWSVTELTEAPDGSRQSGFLVIGLVGSINPRRVTVEYGASTNGPWDAAFDGAPVQGVVRAPILGMQPGAQCWIAITYWTAQAAAPSVRRVLGPFTAPPLVADVSPNAPGLSQIKADIAAAFGDILDVSGRIDQTRADLDAADQNLVNAITGVDAKANQLVELTAELEVSDQNLINAITGVDAKANQLVELTAELEIADQNLINAIGGVDDKANQLVELTAELEDNKASVASLNAQVARIDGVEAVNATQALALVDLENGKVALSEYNTLKGEVTSARGEAPSLLGQIQSLKSVDLDLENNKASVESLDAQVARIDGVEAVNATQALALVDLENGKVALSEYNTLKAEVTAGRDGAPSLLGQIQNLKSVDLDLENNKASVESLDAQVARIDGVEAVNATQALALVDLENGKVALSEYNTLKAEVTAGRDGAPSLLGQIQNLKSVDLDLENNKASVETVNALTARTTNAEAEIIDLENALATEAQIRAEAVNQLSVRQNPRANIVSNSSGAQGMKGLTRFGLRSVEAYPVTADGPQFVAAAPNAVGENFGAISPAFPINGGERYSLQAELAAADTISGTVRALAFYLDAGGSQVGSPQSVEYPAGDWALRKSEGFLAPVSAVQVRLQIDAAATFGAGGAAGWRRIKLERGMVCTPWTDDASAASMSASLTDQSLAILDLENQNALASWYKIADAAGGKPTRIGLQSSAFGNFIALDAEQIYFGDNTVFDNASDTIQTVWGTTRKVMAWGAPFGSDNLVEWVGPSSIALGSMTKANAGFWVDQSAAYGPTPLPSFWAKVTPTQITRSRTGAGSISTALNDVIVTCYTGTSGATCNWSRVSGDASISYPTTGFTPVFNTTLAAGQTKTALFVGLVAKGGDVDLVYVNVEFSDNV